MRLLSVRSGDTGPCGAEVELAHELRARARILARTSDGEEVAIVLERGGAPLRDGEVLADAGGHRVRVRAAVEDLLHVTCSGANELARAAYHLGNRHVKVEVGDGWLRLPADPVLEAMLGGLGATVSAVRAAFSPEAGAYGGGHHHSHGQDAAERYAPRIHDFANRQ